MTRYFTFTDDKSNKFWQIDADGTTFTVTFGKVGTAGQSQTKAFDTAEGCRKEVDKLIREKTNKGYAESVAGIVMTSPARVAAASPKPTARLADPDKAAIDAVLGRYDDIIRNTEMDQLLPFLQSVDKRHYPALGKKIKEAKKHWCEYVLLKTYQRNGVTHNQWDYRGTWEQRVLVSMSGLALLNLPELKGFDDLYGLIAGQRNGQLARAVLDWAKPRWLTEFLHQQANEGTWKTLPYSQLRELETAGLVDYQPELFARSVGSFQEYVYDYATQKSERQDYQHYIKLLTTDALILSRDIPTLFDYPIPIHDSFGSIQNKAGRYERISIWPLVFARLLDTGKLDRNWFLERCLTVQTKDWNINLRAFYRKQAEAATPVPADWLALQSTLFPLLAAQHPHVVNWAIGLVKEISTEPDFRAGELLEWASAVMMRDDCKTGLKTLLSVLERLMKTQPAHCPVITQLLTGVFALNDLSLQTKVAALLTRYGDPASPDLQTALQTYAGQMLGNVAGDLRPFLMADETTTPGKTDGAIGYRYAPKPVPKLVTGQEIHLPGNWNDLMFLIGKFIGSDEVMDVEILMNALLFLPADMPADFREQLKPYEKKLEKSQLDTWTKRFTQHYLLHWLSGSDKPFEVVAPGSILTLRLQLYRLQHLDRKRKAGSKLLLLSLPTHAPHWVEPVALVSRLLAYQQAGETIESLDLAIAIARMPRENTAEALMLCQKLNADMAPLMRYCLGATDILEMPRLTTVDRLLSAFQRENKHVEQQALWATAARTVEPDAELPAFLGTPLAEFPNVVRPFAARYGVEERWYESKNYQTGQLERISWQVLTFSLPVIPKPVSVLLYSNDLSTGDSKEYTYYDLHPVDASFWYSLIPQQPDPLFTFVAKYGCNISEVERTLNQSLRLMLLPDFQFRAMSMLVLACGLLGRKRETSALAAEVVIQHAGEQTLDPAPLGGQVGWLLANNYAPVQRLADGLNLVRDVSPLHNKALLLLLDALFAPLATLPDLPRNTRKLLEIYLDLLVKTAEPPAEPTAVLVKKWQSGASLKKLCTDILNLA